MVGAKAVTGVSLFICVCILLSISMSTQFWALRRSSKEGLKASLGLWQTCFYDANGKKDCTNYKGELRDAVFGARICMVPACCLAFIALFCTVAIFTAERAKVRLIVVGVMYGITGLIVLVGTIWFAIVSLRELEKREEFSFGYSIIVGWVSVAIAITSGILLVAQAYCDNEKYKAIP